jgi:Flp pilus assembly protein TadD
MWNGTKRAIAGIVLGAVAATTGGCATTFGAHKEARLGVADGDSQNDSPAARPNTMYGMCRILRAQGKTEQAELALVGLMREFPEFSPTYNDLAEIRLERGRLDEAVKYLDDGIKIAPTDPVLHNNAGVCALLMHDYAKALEHFQAAAAVAPYEARYKANVALATGLSGDPEAGKALYQGVLSNEAAEFNMELVKQMLAPQEIVAPAD